MKLELIKAFSRRSRAVAAKKCKKKRDTRAKLLFYQAKPIAFCRSRSRRRRRCFLVLFDWSHRKILCTDSKVRTTIQDSNIHPESEFERVKDCCYLHGDTVRRRIEQTTQQKM